ncbi:MAG: hypothetical protein Hyperionvirus19_38 [Hyperionvirus sp.]|uniref:F-box domain-containing protein n=1 Tax=Hyperionvirus sp. TaxID=2487770 RepID=A0A3G5ACA0_9VIRU|nr:MAG: hypothetical protein Hyperionvirus19_38 [Hyperionvirus sp.]
MLGHKIPFYVLFQYLDPHDLIKFSSVHRSFREEIYYKARPLIDIKTLDEGAPWISTFNKPRFRRNNKILIELDYRIYQIPIRTLAAYLDEYDLIKISYLHPYLYRELYDIILELKWTEYFDGCVFLNIPEDIINKIANELRQRNLNISELNIEMMRTIRKSNNISKCQFNYILSMIRYGSPPILSTDTKNKVTSMFRNIEKSSKKYLLDNGLNNNLSRLNFHYVLYKIFQTLGMDIYLGYLNINMMSSQHALSKREPIWEKICIDLKYPFIPFLDKSKIDMT